MLKRRSGLIAVLTLSCGGIVARLLQFMYHPFKLSMSFLNRILGVFTQMLMIQTLFNASTVKNISTQFFYKICKGQQNVFEGARTLHLFQRIITS